MFYSTYGPAITGSGFGRAARILRGALLCAGLVSIFSTSALATCGGKLVTARIHKNPIVLGESLRIDMKVRNTGLLPWWSGSGFPSWYVEISKSWPGATKKCEFWECIGSGDSATEACVIGPAKLPQSPGDYSIKVCTYYHCLLCYYPMTGSCVRLDFRITPGTDCEITCPADVNVPTDAGVCYATNVSLGSPTVSDACSGAIVKNDAPTQFPVGTTTVTWTVTYDGGKTKSCSQKVTVTDTEPPLITCPDDVTVDANPDPCCASHVALGTPRCSDNCEVATITNDAPAPTCCFHLGQTTVTWTATDASGNKASCTQKVTVTGVDTQPPLIVCPPDVAVSVLTGVPYATGVELGDPYYSDNCPGCSITNDAPTQFPVGETTVTWTATDAAGNTASCTQKVTVTEADVETLEYVGDLFAPYQDLMLCAIARNGDVGLLGVDIQFSGVNVSRSKMSAHGVGDATDATGLECLLVSLGQDIYEIWASEEQTQVTSPPVVVTVYKPNALGVFAGGALDLYQWEPVPTQRRATFGLQHNWLGQGRWEGLMFLDNDNPSGPVRIICRGFDSAVQAPPGVVTFTGLCKIQVGGSDPITKKFQAVVAKKPGNYTFTIRVFKFLNVVQYYASGKIKDGGIVINP